MSWCPCVRDACACFGAVGTKLRKRTRQAGLERAAEAVADPVAASALRTANMWLQNMEKRRRAQREQEARRAFPPSDAARPYSLFGLRR